MNKYITINKNGIFYQVFGNDAKILHYLFDYKVVNNKIGFPLESIEKVKTKLDELNISYIINGDSVLENDFKGLNKYEEYNLLANSKMNIDKKINILLAKIHSLSPKEIEELLDCIDDKINETR